MFCRVNCLYLQGIQGILVSVEADVNDGLPGFSLVGYLASEVREAQDRVRTAIKNLGFSLPPKKVTVNLSPADIRKEGTGFDLAIAVAVLGAYGEIERSQLEKTVFLGELGLDGIVKGIPGVLALMDSAGKYGFSRVFLPRENLREASVIPAVPAFGVGHLREIVKILKGENMPSREQSPSGSRTRADQTAPFSHSSGFNCYDVDFSEINGQRYLRRAAEVAVAGMHNLLMIGPAGSGKTMVAKRLPTIMPGLTLEESIEISKIYSICHLLPAEDPLVKNRPFRAPHHTISAQALAGGGLKPKPGEISLASGGILFLDELPEMKRAALETLRQPLEERQVTISRLYGTVCYPADFQLVAAMNPGRGTGGEEYHGNHREEAGPGSSFGERRRYLNRISRPLLDRIDICVEADSLTFFDVQNAERNETSAVIRARVEAARQIQKERFMGLGISCNGQMSGRQVKNFCRLGKEETRFMEQIFTELELSARTYDKILKVARTAADLEGEKEIHTGHLSEAVTYARVKERYWGK